MWYSIVLFDFQDIHELDIDWGVAADYGEDVDGAMVAGHTQQRGV